MHNCVNSFILVVMGSQGTWSVSGTPGEGRHTLQHVVDDLVDPRDQDMVYQSIVVPKPKVIYLFSSESLPFWPSLC